MLSTEPDYIIAIGASAGGLEEINTFFDNTPLDGVAYVIVQHLSADFKSRMVELLARRSKLKIEEAEEATQVKTNHVYLIPNDKFMTIKNGKLYLTNKENITGPHLTINKFFNSLSVNSGKKAIGIILSGLGSDGTEGVKAIKKAGLKIGRDINICLDVAANELYVSGKYKIKENNKPVTADELINYYKSLCNKYPIVSIEDPIFEDDWNVWKKLTRELGKKVQIVGDDLFVTNLKRLKKGVKELAANAILIKPNQIGTVTETLEVINFAKKNKFNTIISHRSGDSEDTFIADLAVATESSQIKTGSLARSERVSKYNRLLRIEEEIGKKSEMVKLI